MSSTILNFLITIPVENTLLRAAVMVAEMLAIGGALYCLWELILRLPRNLGSFRNAHLKPGKAGKIHSTVAGSPDEENFADMPLGERAGTP